LLAVLLPYTSSETSLMRKFALFAALAASFAISACNTVAGAGRDVQAAGQAVEETAQDARR
jgi:predicted small secreted protein